MKDVPIPETNDRKVIINALKAFGVIFNERHGTQKLKIRLQNYVIEKHPLHKVIDDLDDMVIKNVFSKLKLAVVSRSLKRMRTTIVNHLFEYYKNAKL